MIIIKTIDQLIDYIVNFVPEEDAGDNVKLQLQNGPMIIGKRFKGSIREERDFSYNSRTPSEIIRDTISSMVMGLIHKRKGFIVRKRIEEEDINMKWYIPSA